MQESAAVDMPRDDAGKPFGSSLLLVLTIAVLGAAAGAAWAAAGGDNREIPLYAFFGEAAGLVVGVIVAGIVHLVRRPAPHPAPLMTTVPPAAVQPAAVQSVAAPPAPVAAAPPAPAPPAPAPAEPVAAAPAAPAQEPVAPAVPVAPPAPAVPAAPAGPSVRDLVGIDVPIVARIVRSSPEEGYADVLQQLETVAKSPRIVLCTSVSEQGTGELARGLAEALSAVRHKKVAVLQAREEAALESQLDPRQVGPLVRSMLTTSEMVVIDAPHVASELTAMLVQSAAAVLIESPQPMERDSLAEVVAKFEAPKKRFTRGWVTGLVLLRDA